MAAQTRRVLRQTSTNDTENRVNEQVVTEAKPDEVAANPLLRNISMPGETFRLPSCGLLYKDDELSQDVRNGEVTVNPMVTMDEIVMRSPDKLFSGVAITETFHHCIPQILKPMRLFAKDMDFLLVCLRKVSYGDEIDVSARHGCEGGLMHSYRIPLSPFIKNTKFIDPTTTEQKFGLTLTNGQELVLNPPRFDSMVNLFHVFGNKRDEDKDDSVVKQELFQTILGIVNSIDGIKDEKMITEWLDQVPVGWVYQITEKIEQVSDWGPDFNIKVECKDCKQQMTLSTPLNPISLFF